MRTRQILVPPLAGMAIVFGLAGQTAFEAKYRGNLELAYLVRGSSFPNVPAQRENVLRDLGELARDCAPGGFLQAPAQFHPQIAAWCAAAANPRQTVARALTKQARGSVASMVQRMRDLREGRVTEYGPGIRFDRFAQRYLQWRIRFDLEADRSFHVPELGVSVPAEIFEPLRPEILPLWEAAKQAAKAPPVLPVAAPPDLNRMARGELLRRHPNAVILGVFLEKAEFTVYHDRVWPSVRFKSGLALYRLPEDEGYCRAQYLRYAEMFDLWKGGYQKPPPPEQNEEFLSTLQITLCPK
ncbi:MAG: hypothetical protein JNK87_39970 [Bryobacterales bacterium]|nr:hypothetical protein [Bryobacterales bacterium]